MRTVRFEDPAGATRTGEWTDDGIEFGGETYDPDSVNVLAPTTPSKIVCLGSNYVGHIEEGNGEIPERPLLFLKGPNAVAGHGDTITLPNPETPSHLLPEESTIDTGNGRIDYEAEVGVVIGRQCRNVAAEDALDVVAGYTCVNDVSNRDDQLAELNWVRGKAFDGSAPMGPVVASPDLVDEDPRIRLWQNGELRQDSGTDEMVCSVREAIAEITSLLTLEAGDVVCMGTPEGIGPLSDGDTIEIEIDGVGRLEHTVSGPE